MSTSAKRKAEKSLCPESLQKAKQTEPAIFDLFTRLEIIGDGNCLFRSIAHYIYGNQNLHDVIRRDLIKEVKSNVAKYRSLYHQHEQRALEMDILTHLVIMEELGEWGTQFELDVAARLYSFNYYVYGVNIHDVCGHYFFPTNQRTFYFEFFNGNHYNVLVYKTQDQTSNTTSSTLNRVKKETVVVDLKPTISLKPSVKKNAPSKKDAKTNDVETKSATPTTLDNELSIKHVSKTKKVVNINSLVNKTSAESVPTNAKIIQDEKVDKSSKQEQEMGYKLVTIMTGPAYKEEIVKIYEPLTKLYSLAKGNNNSYNEAYSFFESHLRPKRLENKPASSYKNWKKNIQQRYELLKKAVDRNSQSRLAFIKDSNTKLIIPYASEIQMIIREAQNIFHQSTQSKIKHNGINITIENIKLKSLYWATITEDVRKHIATCIDCIEDRNGKAFKVPKIIQSDWPLERIVIDLWTIPKKMQESTPPYAKYHYVLTCVDHFSKFKWSYLLRDKRPETVLKNIELVFATYEKPQILQSDNGKEFYNTVLAEYCKKVGVELIRGSVRHPQSQGVVEKVNDFVSLSLTSSWRSFNKEKNIQTKENHYWEIETALQAFVINQNRKVHSVTKIPPQVLVGYRNRNNDEHKAINKEVKETINDFYENRNTKVKNDQVKIGLKVYIDGTLRKDKQRMKLIDELARLKNKLEKKLKPRMTGIITDISDLKTNYIKVKVCGRAHDKIKLGEEYTIHLKYLTLPPEISWNVISEILE